MQNELTDRLMEQAQVFASSWSLVGGVFDRGYALSDTEKAKQDLKRMVQAAIAGHAHQLDAKDAEIAALRQDKARLDWLVSQEHQVWEVNWRYSVYRVIGAEPLTGPHSSAARAIDAAMAQATQHV